MQVGLICDQATGGTAAEQSLQELAQCCELGITRIPMQRGLHWSDAVIMRNIDRVVRECQPHIVHGHGAKGGAYGRLLARRHGARAVYTPHGGTLHYAKLSPAGLVYINLERVLKRVTNGLIFESQYSADVYARKIGTLSCPNRVIHNGLNDDEFEPVKCSNNSANFLFVGEIRKLKGLDTLLQAVKIVQHQRDVSVLIAGDGPDVNYFESRIHALGLTAAVKMLPPIFPATQAFERAQCVVVPSLAESFPYIVLEAAAANVPLLASDVGGIPEIFGPYANRLVPPNDPAALAQAMLSTIDNKEQALQRATELQARVGSLFRIDAMVGAINKFYDQVMDRD